MKNVIAILGNKVAQASLVMGVAALTAVSSAHAALPASVATMFTGLQADFTDLYDTYLWPTVILIVTTVLLLKFFKRGAKSV